MKLALLGIDSHVAALADAVAASPSHEVAVVCGASDVGREVLTAHPAASFESEWEALLLSREFDLLIVGTQCESFELRAEQLRRFVQEGVPTVVVQPAAEAIVCHELAMIQNDTRSLLAAWNPVTAHPAARWIERSWNLQTTGAAAIRQVSFQRVMESAGWPEIQCQLARDAQWITRLIGPPNRVTALSAQSDAGSPAGLAVTLVGEGEAIAQWSTSGAGGEDVISITAGASGTAKWVTASDANVRATVSQGKDQQEMSWTEQDVLRETSHDFLRMIDELVHSHETDRSFDQATRAVEVAEAAKDSNRRNRTIQLHYEEHSEQQTFKSVMAAGGCLILLGVLFVLGASILIDSIGAPVRNNPWWRIWPAYLLAPVVLFLLAQILWRVFASASANHSSPSPPREADSAN